MGKFFLAAASLLWLATAAIQTGPSRKDPGMLFGHLLQKASREIQESAGKRPFKLRNMNDSLEKTAQAVRLMALSGRRDSPDEAGKHRAMRISAAQLLQDARRDYAENSFAILLQAVLSNADGDTPQAGGPTPPDRSRGFDASSLRGGKDSHARNADGVASLPSSQANKLFQEYLLASRTYREFDRQFLKWVDFHMLRRFSYDLLKARGVKFDGREKDIRVVIPYSEFIRFLMHPEPEDRLMCLFFAATILGGAVLLVLASLRGMDFMRFPGSSLAVLYTAIWLGYGCWIFDLAFGLPFHFDRKVTAAVFLLGGILLSAVEAYVHFGEIRFLEPGYKRCRHCGRVIVSLSLECFHCHRPV